MTASSVALTIGPRRAQPPRPRLSSARASVLRTLLAAGGPVTVAALAGQLGQHSNTVREHLDALVADGRVERVRSAPEGRGRPAWLYCPADEDGEHGTPTAELLGGPLGTDGQEYVALAVALIDQVSATSPDPTALARQAGERWGRSLAEERLMTGELEHTEEITSADAVSNILRDLRFTPRPSGETTVTKLTTCPFLDAARRHPEVVCQIHLGIVRGALERLGKNPDDVDLRPFAAPGACLLRLSESQ